jgi:hypothetical protein
VLLLKIVLPRLFRIFFYRIQILAYFSDEAFSKRFLTYDFYSFKHQFFESYIGTAHTQQILTNTFFDFYYDQTALFSSLLTKIIDQFYIEFNFEDKLGL